MSTIIQPANWPTNMSSEDRKVWINEQIARWVSDKRIVEAMTTAELGNLSHTQKAVAYRSLLIIGCIKHCRHNPRAEARIPILTLITYLSDNAKGVCYLSISKMQQMFNRSRQCIVDNILALEQGGLIGVGRVDGMPNVYWPRIPAALAEISPNPVWFVDALTTTPKSRIFGSVDEAIASATADQSSAVNQSTRVDQHQSSAVDHTGQVQPGDRSSPAKEPVKSSTDSISSLNLFSSSQGVPPPVEKESANRRSGGVGATQKEGNNPHGKHSNPMLAALNPSAAARKAYAARNVGMSVSGQVSIGEELRAELLAGGCTSVQIELGLSMAPKYIESSDPDQMMRTVRTAIESWAKREVEKTAASSPTAKSKGFRFTT